MTLSRLPGLQQAVAGARELLRRPEILGVLDHWAAIAEAGYPTRKAIDPLAIAQCLPVIWITDYDRTTRRFLYRLAGEMVQTFYGFSLAGRYLDEVVPVSDYARVNAYFERCVLEPAI